MKDGIKYYNMRVLPLVVKDKDGKGYVDNLTREETNNMSAEQRMLWHIGDEIYLAEIPLTYRGNEINKKLYYVYSELTSEEQEKYFDRSTSIWVSRDHVVTVYDDNSKKFFPTRDKKKPKTKTKIKKNKKDK